MHSIDQSIKKALEDKIFPGAHLLVSKRDKILWDQSYGFAQVEPKKIPLAKNFIFDIASLTKPFCASLLMLQAIAQKKCALENPLKNFYSTKNLKNKTIGQLLNHTSGLPDWKPYYREFKGDYQQNKQLIIDRILHESLINEGKVVYSDLGYILLGDILEKIFQAPLDELFYNYIAQPLKLENTFFRPKNCREKDFLPYVATENCPWRKKVLAGEVHDDNAYVMGGVAGHAGLFSTVYDLKKWIEELNKARNGKSHLIKKTCFDLFYTIPKNGNSQPFFTYGFDTPSFPSQSGKYFSPNTLGHLGYTGCSLWWDLEKDFCIILLTNRVHPTRQNQKIKEYRPQLHDIIFESILLNHAPSH